METFGIDFSFKPDRTIEQRIFVSPPALYDHACRYFKGTGVIVIVNKPLCIEPYWGTGLVDA